jgi:hypothetical protein
MFMEGIIAYDEAPDLKNPVQILLAGVVPDNHQLRSKLVGNANDRAKRDCIIHKSVLLTCLTLFIINPECLERDANIERCTIFFSMPEKESHHSFS